MVLFYLSIQYYADLKEIVVALSVIKIDDISFFYLSSGDKYTVFLNLVNPDLIWITIFLANLRITRTSDVLRKLDSRFLSH